MKTGELVTVILDASGRLCSVWSTPGAAASKAAEYNANPLNDDGTPDTEGPYTAQTWAVNK